MEIRDNIPIFGTLSDEKAFAQIRNAQLSGAARCALMADHHPGFGVPIGGVVAYYDRVSPTGVGYDIACGNKAVRLDADAKDVRRKIHAIMDDVFKKISFGVGRSNNEPVDHELFDDPAWKLSAAASIKDRARSQLGTVGSGNHYVDILIDEQERVWVGVHFGSRGLGHGIAQFYIDVAKAAGHVEEGITTLHDRSAAGEEYIELLNLAGRYAYAGRDWVCAKVARIIGAKIVEEVHNHHNFAWRERHGEDEFWVVRKGATPAFPGQAGFVGGTMAEPAVILEGTDDPLSAVALHSTVHGAGRVMSRRSAKGDKKDGLSGAVSERAMMERVKEAGVVLKGGGVDEAPQCYKRLDEVLAAHGPTIRVRHRLQPIGVAMAGADVRDPYKD